MGNLGDDVLAVVCMLASAAVGGAVTVAALDRDRDAEPVHAHALVVTENADAEVYLLEARARVVEAHAHAEAMRVLSQEALQRDLERELQRLQEEVVRIEVETGR